MKTNIFSALSEKSFLYAWIGEILTLVANHIFNFFLILQVFNITHSNAANSFVVLTIIVPSIIFGVLAGAFVDRWNKRKVLITVNLARALLLLMLAFANDNLIFLYSISFIFSFITQFFIPAELPIIPLLVEKKNYYSANSLFGMAIYGAILVAFVLVGPLIIMLKPFGVLILLSVMLFVATLFILKIRFPYSKNNQAAVARNVLDKANIFEDMKYTLSLISHARNVLTSIFFLALSQTLILVVATIAPGYAVTVLRIPIVQLPMLFVAPAALGTIIGAWIITSYLQNRKKQILITSGIFLSSFSMLLLPYGSKVGSKSFVQIINLYLPRFLQVDILHIIIIIAFILGLSNSLVFVPANTLLQEETSEEFRGKVYGLLNTFIGVLSLLPIIIVGGLADLIGVGAVISGIGVFLFALGILRIFV